MDVVDMRPVRKQKIAVLMQGIATVKEENLE
jgi:hypothetical protein